MPVSPAGAPALRPLVAPVYVPTVVYAAGASLLGPAQVLLALRLGFDPAHVAALATWIGAFGVLASYASGTLVQRWGELRSLWVSTGAAAVALVGTAIAVASHAAGSPVAPVALVCALTLADLADAVWSLARQGLVADLAPPALRGRAMNTYGACQRLGRIAGPSLGAALLLIAGPGELLLAAATLMAFACVLMSRGLGGASPSPVTTGAGAPPSYDGQVRGPRRALLILGAGVLALAAVRTAKETLVPLWGAGVLGLPEAQVAVVVGAAAAMELVLFWPAGLALDRIGRAPVVVTALVVMGAGLIAMPLREGVGWYVATALVIGLGDGVGAGIVKTLGVDIAPAPGRSVFLGQWQAVASLGAFLAPALASVVIAASGMALALPVIGGVGLLGGAWMARWTPRLVPHPHAPGRPGAPTS